MKAVAIGNVWGLMRRVVSPSLATPFSPLDTLHATIPTRSFVSNQSALVTCDANYFTDPTNRQANSYGVFCESFGTLSVPEAVLHASTLEGTIVAESCKVTCDEKFTLTGLGGDMNKQTLECLLTGQFARGKECKRVRFAIPLRIVSGSLRG